MQEQLAAHFNPSTVYIKAQFKRIVIAMAQKCKNIKTAHKECPFRIYTDPTYKEKRDKLILIDSVKIVKSLCLPSAVYYEGKIPS